MKYMIGSGKSRRPGWLTIDADPRVKPDILATLPPLPGECQGAEAFELIHVLEHFHKWEAEELLRQFWSALRLEGELILELPNLESAIKTLSNAWDKPADQWGMWVLYGSPEQKNPLYGHKWGWTPKTLEAALREAGFRRIRHERPRYHIPDRDVRIVAVKTDP